MKIDSLLPGSGVGGVIPGGWGAGWIPGGPTIQSIEDYEVRAKGGYGLVCIEATTVDTRTNNFAQMLNLTRDKHVAA